MNPSNAPSPNLAPSPSNPDQASAEFLGLNLDAFQELVAFATAAQDFTYALAEINFASDGDWLVQALTSHPVAQEVRFIVLDFTGQTSLALLKALQAYLAPLQVAAEDNPVLLVRGLATAIGVKGDYPNFLKDLNLKRDVLAAQVPYPMVLFLPDYAIDRLAQYARDFWTWRSGHFHFRTARPTLETAQTRLAAPDRTQPTDSLLVKQARIDQLERLLSEYTTSSDHPPTHPRPLCIAIALELGDAYRSLAQYEPARRHYHKALDWVEAEQNPQQKANALYGLGQVHRLKDDNTAKAMARLGQALDLFRAVGDRLGEANTLQAVGDVLQFLDRRTEALKHYEQALDLFRAVGARLGEANTLLMMGRLARKAGERNQAIAYLQQAIGAYQAIEAIQGEGNGHFLLGETYFYLGEYATAIGAFQTALPIFEQTGDRYSQAMTWRNLGEARVRQGQAWEARTAYETARDLYRQAGLDDQAAACEQAIKNLSRQVVVAPPQSAHHWRSPG